MRLVCGRAFLVCVALVAALLSLSTMAWADGLFVAPKMYRQLPSIPSQRALVAYRDGVEKLLVESSLDGQGESICWIIPVPNKPTRFEKGSPGLLLTLFLNLQPKIIAEKKPGTLGKRAAGTPFMRLAVQVEEHAIVGSFEVSILNVACGRALNTWLDEQGLLRLDAAAEKVVDEYVADGWRFVVAKLMRDGDGLSRPHPLSLEFPCDRPVYPMRLSRFAESDIHVELFVVADRRATRPPLHIAFCNRFALQPGSTTAYREASSDETLTMRMDQVQVAHPRTQDYLWDGCVITRLSGTIRPEQMSEDFYFVFSPLEAYREEIRAEDAANDPRFTGIRGTMAAFVESPGNRGLADEARTIAKTHHGFPGYSPQAAIRVLRDHFTYTIARNPFTRERIGFTDCPGDIEFLDDERGLVCRTYEDTGEAEDHVLAEAGYASRPRTSDEVEYWLAELARDDEAAQFKAMQHFVFYPDKRAIEPLLDILGNFAEDPNLAGYAQQRLEYASGLDLAEHGSYEEKYERYSAWWEAHKEESRGKWLHDALEHPEGMWDITIAYFLTQYGDESMADKMVEWLPHARVQERYTFPPQENRLDIAEALARIGRDEGYACLEAMKHQQTANVLVTIGTPRAIRTLLDWCQDDRLSLRTDARLDAMYLCVNNQQALLGIVLDDLAQLRKDGAAKTSLIEYEASILGLATRTVPPLDIEDPLKMGAFLDQVRAKYATLDQPESTAVGG